MLSVSGKKEKEIETRCSRKRGGQQCTDCIADRLVKLVLRAYQSIILDLCLWWIPARPMQSCGVV